MRIAICVTLVTALVVSAMPSSDAQTPVRGVITNVRSVVTGGSVEITYDLASPKAGLAFDVTVEASEDGGKSFPVKLSSVTGDIGPAIMPGTARRVVWNAARDVERAAFDRFQFRITAIAVPRAALPDPKPTSGAQPTPADAGSSGGGGGTKWLLIGGGVAAAGAAAALAGGGSAGSGGSGGSPTPVATGPTVSDVSVSGLTDVLIATANSVTFSVTASSPAQGEALSATWTFGDGTTAPATWPGGAVSVTKTFANAGVFVPRVTVSSRSGSVSRDYQTITVGTVTGRWVGQWRLSSSTGTFTINLTQNGSQVSGDSVDSFANGGRSSVSGSVSGPPSRLRLRLTYSDNTFYDMDVTGSADQRTFSGTLAGVNSFPFSMTKQ